MKRLLAIILAALMMCSLLATAVWADEVEDGAVLVVEVEPEEALVAEDEYVYREPLPLYSDEIGDYHSYEDGAVKAYVRLNQDAVTVVMEGSAVAIYDNDGNYITLDERFNLSEHPWIEEITDEYVRQNSEYDESGNLIVMPAIGISYYAPPHFGSEEKIDVGIDETDMVLENEARQPMYDENGEPMEGSDGSAGTASNPNTGVAVAVTPTVFAAAIAFATKNKRH